MPPSRRDFLSSAAGAMLLAASDVKPDLVRLQSDSGWMMAGEKVQLQRSSKGLTVTLVAPGTSLHRIHLRWLTPGWLTPASPPARYLGDDWERSYGTLGWRMLEPDRILPWYFLSFDGKRTRGFGVQTAPAAFCCWQVDNEGISLWLDIRNGGRPTHFGKRSLEVATIVSRQYEDRSPFAAACDFCRQLCPTPRLPSTPIYGANNWYYAYGNSSAGDIRRDSENLAELAPKGPQPYMVIDDGWAPNKTAGPWNTGNGKFGDMAALASEMRGLNVQPGLWLRPLFTTSPTPESWLLPGRRRFTLDPSVPEVLARCQEDMTRAASWGFSLIKHDFSTYDIFGRWGFAMGADLTDAKWNFSDTSRTSAEIILAFYRGLREAAGHSLLLGCNTVGHLSAGVFELQRTGDDTSGRDWNRTRKMGINTLAFRLPQHNAFFAIDADCVGLTRQIEWSLNRQWLNLLAGSGTPLFVSAAPDALGTEQKAALREAFQLAAAQAHGQLAEPLDWLDTTTPERWKLTTGPAQYRWFGSDGASYSLSG